MLIILNSTGILYTYLHICYVYAMSECQLLIFKLRFRVIKYTPKPFLTFLVICSHLTNFSAFKYIRVCFPCMHELRVLSLLQCTTNVHNTVLYYAPYVWDIHLVFCFVSDLTCITNRINLERCGLHVCVNIPFLAKCVVIRNIKPNSREQGTVGIKPILHTCALVQLYTYYRIRQTNVDIYICVHPFPEDGISYTLKQ
jgi:hypothetical protein